MRFASVGAAASATPRIPLVGRPVVVIFENVAPAFVDFHIDPSLKPAYQVVAPAPVATTERSFGPPPPTPGEAHVAPPSPVRERPFAQAPGAWPPGRAPTTTTFESAGLIATSLMAQLSNLVPPTFVHVVPPSVDLNTPWPKYESSEPFASP